MTHRDALFRIIKICNEAAQYSRRTAAIHNTAMEALGFTEGQRQERHVKALQRFEQWQIDCKEVGRGQADRNHRSRVEEDTGEAKEKINKYEGI